jgi:hypothetical protein
MIETISDFLQELLNKEKQILGKQQIRHRPTIGKMYEGLTAELLTRSLFAGFNLKLSTSSFIRNSKGILTDELDVVLSVGDGEKIPHTDQYIFEPTQVVAVFQVKKNLFSKDLIDSYLNLRNVVSMYSEEDEISDFQIELVRDAFSSICGKDITKESRKFFNSNENHIFYVLKHEAIMPVRIVLGYNGFKMENNFREAFVEYIGKNITTDISEKKYGFGPANLPSQIICNQFSILKNNGMPFGFPLKDGKWQVLLTTSEKPVYFMLEYIWTRLSYMFKISSDIFGEDLFMEQVSRFLDCNILNVEGNYVWHYNYFKVSDEFFRRELKGTQWQPVIVTDSQFLIINYLCKYEEINILANHLINSLAKKEGKTTVQLAGELCATSITYLAGNTLKLLTKQCACVVLPDGRLVAGENVSGRLTRWVTNEMNKLKK